MISWNEAWEYAIGSVGRYAMQDVSEFAEALRIAAEIDAKVVLEIGSASGGSLWGWKQIAPEVLAIDYPETEVYGGIQLNDYGVPVGLFDSHSKEARGWLEDKLHGRKLDVLFIDGDHRYEGCRADYYDYSPYVRPGGLILIHDVVHVDMELTRGVVQFWNELDVPGKYVIENVTITERVGIGVVRVPERPAPEPVAHLDTRPEAARRTVTPAKRGPGRPRKITGAGGLVLPAMNTKAES